MASVSVSHLIIFIASMMIAASVAGVFTNSVGQLSDAVAEQGLDVSSDVRTDIEVISDAGSDAVYDDANNEITLHVKNTGSQQLSPQTQELDVFLNGTYVTDFTVTLLDSGDTWRPGTVVRLDISESLPLNQDHRVKVIVNGDEEVFTFRS